MNVHEIALGLLSVAAAERCAGSGEPFGDWTAQEVFADLKVSGDDHEALLVAACDMVSSLLDAIASFGGPDRATMIDAYREAFAGLPPIDPA